MAAPSYYHVSVDDYVSLVINGVEIAHYDAFPWGTAAGSVDLAPGWYPISLTYRNRWGTSALYFYELEGPGAPATELVPLARFRSRDGAGEIVSGLRADYYTLGGALLDTVFGEGPLGHGWFNHYEGVDGKSGGTTVDLYWRNNWRSFEERLTGEILVGELAIPEPVPLLLLSIGLGWLFLRRRLFESPTATMAVSG